METRIERVSSRDPKVQSLIQELDTYLNSLYPPEDNHLDTPEELEESEGAMFGVYVDDHLAGIGAVKFFRDYAEIKRMYIDPRFRGRGFSRAVLERLELEATNRGLRKLRLETGHAQQSAWGLYRSFNYRESGPFGSYTSNPSSLFMEKTIRL